MADYITLCKKHCPYRWCICKNATLKRKMPFRTLVIYSCHGINFFGIKNLLSCPKTFFGTNFYIIYWRYSNNVFSSNRTLSLRFIEKLRQFPNKKITRSDPKTQPIFSGCPTIGKRSTKKTCSYDQTPWTTMKMQGMVDRSLPTSVMERRGWWRCANPRS